MRLIDADKLIDDYNASGGTISDLMELILDAVDSCTADSVPVVRCKDCVHYHLYECPPFMCYACDRAGAVRPMEEDDFCKYGESHPQ